MQQIFHIRLFHCLCQSEIQKIMLRGVIKAVYSVRYHSQKACLSCHSRRQYTVKQPQEQDDLGFDYRAFHPFSSTVSHFSSYCLHLCRCLAFHLCLVVPSKLFGCIVRYVFALLCARIHNISMGLWYYAVADWARGPHLYDKKQQKLHPFFNIF